MYCRNCGKEIMNEAVYCVHCGCSTGPTQPNYQYQTPPPPPPPQPQPQAQPDAPNIGMAVLGFFIPLAGLIIWAINKDTQPLMAGSALKGAIIGFCVSIAFTILSTIFYFIALESFYGSLFEEIFWMY